MVKVIYFILIILLISLAINIIAYKAVQLPTEIYLLYRIDNKFNTKSVLGAYATNTLASKSLLDLYKEQEKYITEQATVRYTIEKELLYD